MKKLLIIAFLLSAAACSSPQRISNGGIEMEVDGRMHVRIRSLHGGTAPSATTSDPSTGWCATRPKSSISGSDASNAARAAIA